MYHQKRGFAIGTKFAPPYSNLFMTGLEREFFKTVSLNLSCGYDTLMRFFVYGKFNCHGNFDCRMQTVYKIKRAF